MVVLQGKNNGNSQTPVHQPLLEFEIGKDLPYILFLPIYTATAWYHRRLPEELQQRELPDVLSEVEGFAFGTYSQALLKGSSLSKEEQAKTAQALARYTGLTVDYIERTNLRIEIFRFIKELLRDERLTVGRLDSRFTGYDRDASGEHSEFDPSINNIMGPYMAQFIEDASNQTTGFGESKPD